MPEKSSPITLDMQQDVKQTQKWRRQTLTNAGLLTDSGSKSQLQQSWFRDGPGWTAECKTNLMTALSDVDVGKINGKKVSHCWLFFLHMNNCEKEFKDLTMIF